MSERRQQGRERASKSRSERVASGPDGRADGGDDGVGARDARAAGERAARVLLRESRERRLCGDDRYVVQVAALRDGAHECREPRRLCNLLLPHTRLPTRPRANLRLLEVAPVLSASDD